MSHYFSPAPLACLLAISTGVCSPCYGASMEHQAMEIFQRTGSGGEMPAGVGLMDEG